MDKAARARQQGRRALAGLWLGLGLQAAFAGGDNSLQPQGAAVLDTTSQLVWERCVAGMFWSGSGCRGEPLRMTHAEAQTWAAERARADHRPWRLPRVNELQHLRLHLRQQSDAGALFPDAPSAWYWTSNASLNTGLVNQYDYDNIRRGRSNGTLNRIGVNQGWAVHVDSGEARGDVSRQSLLVVRVVRAAAAEPVRPAAPQEGAAGSR